jgi:uncharacterized membrane protein
VTQSHRPFVASGIVLGISLAGFFDGIVFHQLLQWHHMLSDTRWSTRTVHGLEVNTLADGAFHVACLATTLVGTRMLAMDVERTGTAPTAGTLAGPLLVGVGGFNIVEGSIDHMLLGIHHVREGANHAAWDVSFLLVFALVAAAGGWFLRRHGDGAGLPRALDT